MTDETESGKLERILVALVWILIVASRLLARQRSLWEWDDHIFGLALRKFAPLDGFPHPPFYPGYLCVARLLRRIVSDDVRALTGVSVAASAAAPYFFYRIARSLVPGRTVALAAAALFAFFPAVWFHSGVPLSDPLGLALSLAALWIALSAVRRPGFARLAAGAVVLALAASVRPQTALIAIPALAVAAWRAGWFASAGAFAASATTFFLAYVRPVTAATGGIGGAIRLLRQQERYVVATDSRFGIHFDSTYAVGRYLADIWGNDALACAATLLALAGLALLGLERRWKALGWLAVSFLPYAIVCWVFLDPTVAGRYAIGYLPVLALGLAVLFDRLERGSRLRPLPVLSGALAIWCAATIWPAVRLVHTRISPPAAAAAAIREQAGSNAFGVIFSPALLPQATYWFAGRPLVSLDAMTGDAPPPKIAVPAWQYRPPRLAERAGLFSWPPMPALSRVGRGRFLSVVATSWASEPQFEDGWYPAEVETSANPPFVFRWMSHEATIRIPPSLEAERISLELIPPSEVISAGPWLTVTLNGGIVRRDRLRCSVCPEDLTLSPPLLSASGWNVLRVSTDRTFTPVRNGGTDPRELGLRVRLIRFGPAAGSP